MEVVLVAGAESHFLCLFFIVRLVTQPQYVVLPELRPTSLASIGIVTDSVINVLLATAQGVISKGFLK